MILLSTMLHGVWSANGGSEGNRILRNSIAVVLQPCGQCGMQVQGMIKE